MRLLGILIAIAILAGSHKTYAAEHTIRIVSLANTNDEDYVGALAFKEIVENESDGAIEVVIFTGGQLCGSPTECLLALQGGVMDVFMSTLGGLANFYPEIQFLDLPYLFPDDETLERLYRGPLVDDLREAILKKTGLRLMTIGNTGGWRNIANTKREVRTPSDLKGLKLRTISSPIQIELTRALGASPTPIPWPELYIALATGTVDGSKNGLTDIVGMGFEEHIKFVTMDGHAYMSALWLMNDDTFGELSAEMQSVVKEGFVALQEVTMRVPKERLASAIAEFEAAGGKIYRPTPEEKALFVEAARPVYDWYTRQFGTHWLEKVDAAVAAIEGTKEIETNE
ncbi:MAG: TRAP transporter substrate-binding protein DctP [Candidatus Hydrogenedentota bacterium]